MDKINFVSFNLHDFNSSETYLCDLLNNNDIVFVQEHWQLSNNFGRFASVSKLHDFVASDSMKYAAQEGIIRGRPYGGVACFWPKCLGKFIRPIQNMSNPRVLALEISSGSVSVLLFNVYMPYMDLSNRSECMNEFLEVLSCLEMEMKWISDC